MRRTSSALILLALLLGAGHARGALIQVTPADNWTKIEAAKAGDIVEIAPGTYQFRVTLAQQGTAASPIVIRAKDPANRPVWDLGGKAVSLWPGSYTAPDKGRGCWQVRGSHYSISGIVFKNCQDEGSAGLRAVDCGPLTIRDCLFVGNTNGLTGSSQGMTVEFSEFHDNGKLVATGNMTHNIYIYGGVFALRYSYVHDPHEGQNFHIRARDSVIEYNWLARPDAYPGDIMSCNTLCGSTGTNPITQKMLLRGNVIIQGTPKNVSQIIAMYNDEPGGSYDDTGESTAMELTMVGNTVVANQTQATHRLVNMRNDSGVSTTVHLSNNIFVKLGSIFEAGSPSGSNWSVDGQNNWLSSSTAATTKLAGTITGPDPGFANAGAKDYTLSGTSGCLGKAAAIAGVPDKEYYLNETTKLQYRARATAKDLGAFERGNASAPVGAYGAPPVTPDGGGTAKSDANLPPPGDPRLSEAGLPMIDLPLPVGDGAIRDSGASTKKEESGCNCGVGGFDPGAGAAGLWLLGAALAVLGRRRSRT